MIKSKKKNCVEIKKINGNISKSIDGALSSVKRNGKIILFSSFLKKEISSKTLKIIINDKKIDEITKIFFIKDLIRESLIRFDHI